MTNLFTDIPLQVKDDVYYAVVEIPKGSRVKYEYNESLGAIEVDRVFRTPVGYPQNYGFFPKTWNRFDQDPMDVIVLSKESYLPASIIKVRVIGMIEMEDSGELDHKIIAVPDDYSGFDHAFKVADVDKEVIDDLVWFLGHYKDREPGKSVKILGIKEKDDAIQFLKDCSNEYEKK